jgi:ribosomal-protein-alanine N-acetyltransferase
MIFLKDPGLIPVTELQRLADNNAIAKNLRDVFPHPYSMDDAHQFITFARNGVFGHTFGIFDEQTFIGAGSIVPQHDIHKNNGEIGYWIGEEYWGRGFAGRAVELLTTYAFNELKLLRIFAGVFATNVASMKVLEKSGYTLEAVLKSSIVKNGEILDECIYSILKQ